MEEGNKETKQRRAKFETVTVCLATSLGLPDPWRLRHHNPSKHWEPFTQ